MNDPQAVRKGFTTEYWKSKNLYWNGNSVETVKTFYDLGMVILGLSA